MEPFARDLFTPNRCERGKIGKTPTINTAYYDFAPLDQRVERDGGVATLLPIISPNPTIRAQPQSDLDVECLGSPAPSLLLASILGGLIIFDQPFHHDTSPAIERHHPPVCRFFPFLRICGDIVGKLIQHG